MLLSSWFFRFLPLCFIAFFICYSAFAQEEFLYDYQNAYSLEDNDYFESHGSVQWPYLSNAICYGGVETGYRRFQAPGFSYVLVVFAAPPFPIATYPALAIKEDQPRGSTTDIFFGTRFINAPDWLGTNFAIELRGSYFTGQERQLHDSQALADEVLQLFPINGIGTAGTITGPTPYLITFDRSYQYDAFDLTFKTDYYFQLLSTYFIVEPFLQGSFDQFFQNYTQADALRVFRLNEKLSTNYYDIGGGIKFIAPFSSSFALILQGGFFGSYAHTRFNGNEIVNSPGEGNTFEINDMRLDHHTWSTKFKGSGELSYQHRTLNMALVGSYEYWGYLPKIINPQFIPGTIFATAARLGSTYSWNYSVTLKFTVPLY